MIKKIVDFCAGLPMTVLGGVFLLASFVLPRMGFLWGEALAWGCVAVCGTPLLYLALRRLAVNQGIAKISSALLISRSATFFRYIVPAPNPTAARTSKMIIHTNVGIGSKHTSIL